MVGSVSYNRWGSTVCRTGASLVYSGKMGATVFSSRGGTANHICMPDNPEYSRYNTGVHGYSLVYGTEYEVNVKGSNTQHNAPCAVCYVFNKSTFIMYPSRITCPTGWTVEYKGYLMSEHRADYRTMFICVDDFMETIPGTSGHESLSHLFNVEASCNDVINCPPYNSEKELACVVCSK